MNSIRRNLLVACLVLAGIAVRAAEKEAGAKDLERLQGEWTMISGLADGTAVPEEMLRSSSRVCKSNETAVVVGGQLIMRAKFKIDPSKNPKTIDYEVLEGPAKGGTLLGIYEFEGETVKFCFGAPGQERPPKFGSQLGERRTFSVWQRKKDAATKPAQK